MNNNDLLQQITKKICEIRDYADLGSHGANGRELPPSASSIIRLFDQLFGLIEKLELEYNVLGRFCDIKREFHPEYSAELSILQDKIKRSRNPNSAQQELSRRIQSITHSVCNEIESLLRVK